MTPTNVRLIVTVCELCEPAMLFCHLLSRRLNRTLKSVKNLSLTMFRRNGGNGIMQKHALVFAVLIPRMDLPYIFSF